MTRKHGFSILSVVESFVFKLSRLTLIAQTLSTRLDSKISLLWFHLTLRKIKGNARIRVTQVVVPLRSLSDCSGLSCAFPSYTPRIDPNTDPNPICSKSRKKKMQLLIRPGKKTKKYQTVQKYWTRSSLLTFSMLLHCSIKKLHGIPRLTSKRSDWRLLRVDYFILQLVIWLDDPNQAFDGTCDPSKDIGANPVKRFTAQTTFIDSVHLHDNELHAVVPVC